MRTTVLFSAVDEVAGRHPLFVAELREFFRQHTLPVGTSEVVPLLADRLEADSAFAEDLVSMLRVVCADEPSVSYLELLGLLLAACDATSHDPDVRESTEPEARRIFNFLVERRRAMKAELSAMPELEDFGSSESSSAELPEPFSNPSLAEWVPSREHLALLSDVETASASRLPEHPAAEPPLRSEPAKTVPDQANAALARALAISADEHDLPHRPVTPVASATPEQVPLATFAQPAPVPALGKSGWMRSVAFGLCGLLVGLLLGLLWHRRSEPVSLEPATAAVEAPSQPVPSQGVHPLRWKPLGKLPHRPWPQIPSLVAAVRTHAATEAAGIRSSVRTPGASPSTSAVSRPAAAPSTHSTTPTLSATLGNAPEVGPGAGAVHPVRLDAPADLLTSQGRSGSRPGRVSVGSAGIMAANLISSPAPSYPVQATAARVQGEVVIEAIVGRDGDVIDTRVISGPPLLRQAALNAVQRWRYRPYEVDGETSEIATTARLSFQLDAQ